MSDIQGLAWFPGIEQIRGCWYTLAHGIAPGVATLEIVPQGFLAPAVGTLAMSYGSMLLEFPDCLVESHSLELDRRGQVWRLTLLDRRWRWRYGQISGHYNRRGPNGALIPESRRSIVDLAALCLDAMGEQQYNLSLMPAAPQPEIVWNAEVPARALAALADSVGCRVVLGLDNIVVVTPTISGFPLPATDDLQSGDFTLETSERPSSLVLACGPTQFQFDFELEPVGLDVDDSIKPIDQLLYRPSPDDETSDDDTTDKDASVWSLADVPHFNCLSQLLFRERARQTVFRWYRIKAAIGSELPASQYWPLPFRLATANPDALDPTLPPREVASQVFGIWHDVERNGWTQNTVTDLKPLDDPVSDEEDKALWRHGFTIDPQNGIVKFPQPVYQLVSRGDDGFQIAPAELVLRTACHVIDATTQAPLRYEYNYDLGSSTAGASPIWVRRPGLALRSITHYDSDYTIESIEDNRAQLDPTCDAVLSGVAQTFSVRQPQVAMYAGLKAIGPSGTIRQVTWSVTLEGTTTRAFQDTDLAADFLSFEERRMLEQS